MDLLPQKFICNYVHNFSNLIDPEAHPQISQRVCVPLTKHPCFKKLTPADVERSRIKGPIKYIL